MKNNLYCNFINKWVFYMICSFLASKYKSILYFCIFLVTFISFSYASDKVNTKEEIEKKQIANEIFNKYQYVAKSLNITQPNDVARDASKILVTSSGISYKVRYLPTPILDITLDYNKKDKKITAFSIKSRLLDTPEKLESYKNNLYIFSKIIDPKLKQNTFENIYNNIDIQKSFSEPKYLKSYISNGFLYEIDAYSRKTQISTLKIREKNKTDESNIDLTKDLRSLYSNTLIKLNIHKESLIYPEIGLSGIKTKKAFFFSSQNISMDILLEMNFRNINPISGTIVYENPKSENNKEKDFLESTLILISLTDNKLSKSQIDKIISNLDIKQAITDKKYYKSVTTENKVYTIGYNSNKLFLSVDIRNAEYDKKVKLENLTKQLYNTAAHDFNLLNKVKLLESQDLSTSLLSSQNTVMFRINPYLTFRIYFDNSTDSISRINIIIPRDILEKNIEVQKNNALIANKMINPDISYQEAENIYTYLKNAYGVTETRIVNNLRYKRCTYKDETLVFSKTDAQDNMAEKSPNLTSSSNPAYNNPNLIYEPEGFVDEDGKRTLRVKSQPLCY